MVGSGYEPALDGVWASASFSWGFAGRGMPARLQWPCNGVRRPLWGWGRAVSTATRRRRGGSGCTRDSAPAVEPGQLEQVGAEPGMGAKCGHTQEGGRELGGCAEHRIRTGRSRLQAG